MIITRPAQITSLLFGVLVVLVAESHGLTPQQQVTGNVCKATEVEFSLLVNQLAVLRLLNESSTSCSLHERELQENRDLKMELDVKAEGLKNELQHYMEAAVNKLKNKTTATITEMDMKNQEAGEMLNAVKEAAVNISRQGEKELQDMRDLRLQLDVKAEELNNDLLNMENELQNKRTAAVEEITRIAQEAAEHLRGKEEVLNASLQQGEKELQEMRELMNDLQEFKTKATEENQNMTAMINDNKAKNEETLQALNEMKETLADLSLVVTRILECEAGWSQYRWSCYKVFKTGVNHAAAKETCQANGAHLATIGSEGENSFVFGLTSTWGIYIGLDDIAQEGVFTWQDGSPFSYSRWSSGQPNNSGGNQNCVVMSTSSYWHDVHCTARGQFACEKRAQ